jgi:hypothetical protein
MAERMGGRGPKTVTRKSVALDGNRSERLVR